eukprot:TRINITY_DN7594_c0_g1_i1.p1 TRINITY_DN7594_c0_g1~~TRINITY_DN7594_c0_g1_i1.p1  ORF type:complete len:194 (-),score=51.96 TRINITY_DN7594_c0_g1_i1:233-739(-)
MARIRSFAAVALIACVFGLFLSQAMHAFVGTTSQPTSLRSSIARQAAAPAPVPPSAPAPKPPAEDFNFELGEVVSETAAEPAARASAVFFAILGFFFVPILKGLTCAILFAAIAYFAANGTVADFVGKSASAKDYADTAKTVEGLTSGVGGYLVKGYNFAVTKVKENK